MDDALGQRFALGVADGSGREIDSGLGQAFGILDRQVADLLTRLTGARKTWGFGLSFLHLRKVKGHSWNHKCVYRICSELELNLRIKPRKRLKRDKPDVMAVPEAPNVLWSMDFMAD